MMTMKEILDYEIHSSRWGGYISNDTLQTVAAKYYAWKVRRKYNRYMQSMKIRDKLLVLGILSKGKS